MIAHAYSSWPGADNSSPEMGSLIDLTARQTLNDLLALQMRLELATGIPVAIYGNTGQTLPGISPARPRLSGNFLPAPKELVPPQDWPRQRGQVIKVTHKAYLHCFITPLMLGNRPIAQVILGPLEIFEPGAQREGASGYGGFGSGFGKSAGALGIPVLPSWRAQAVAELAGTIVSTLSISLSTQIPLAAEQRGTLVSDQATTVMPGMRPAPRGSGEFPARLGSLADDAGMPIHSGISSSSGYIERPTTSGPLSNRMPSYPGSGPFYPPSQPDPMPYYSSNEAMQQPVEKTQPLGQSLADAEERGIAPLGHQALQFASKETGLAESQQTSANWLPALFDGMPQAVIVCAAPNGQIVQANRAARALWPELLAEASGEHAAASAMLASDDYPPEWAGLSIALHQETALFRSEVSMQIAGNTPATLPPTRYSGALLPSQETAARKAKQRSLLVSAFPLRNAQGNITHAVAIFEDLGGLIEREQFKDEFLLVAAHDMRNPLTVISSYTQLLDRHFTLDASSPGQALERARGRLSEIQQQVQLLTDLSEQMYTVTHLQNAYQRPQRDTLNLARLIQRIAVDQRLLNPGRAIEINVEENPCLVEGDPAHLQHIIVNLLKNAVQYSHPAKPILLSLRCTPENNPLWAEISVRDQGIGIPRTSVPHIFERFYRIEDNEQRARMAGLPRPTGETVSLGLGLYLCKQLVEHMGGRIWIDSVEGLGTTVTFTVPLKR